MRLRLKHRFRTTLKTDISLRPDTIRRAVPGPLFLLSIVFKGAKIREKLHFNLRQIFAFTSRNNVT